MLDTYSQDKFSSNFSDSSKGIMLHVITLAETELVTQRSPKHFLHLLFLMRKRGVTLRKEAKSLFRF